MREGEQSEFLGVVLDGRLGLRLRVPERAPVTILTVEPGDVVGWSAVVPPHRSTSTVVALTDAELAYFEARALREALADDDSLAAEFYPGLLGAVSRRLEGTRLQLLDLFGERWVDRL
jgi:CRP-like cAMP-binding protein